MPDPKLLIVKCAWVRDNVSEILRSRGEDLLVQSYVNAVIF